MSRRKSVLVSAGIILGALAVSVVMVRLRPEPPLREPPSRVPFVTTATAVSGAGAIPVHGAGTVRPRAEIDVAAQINGKVAWVSPSFQGGGRVAAGQVLFRIDDADYRNRVRQASANVAAQEVTLLQAQEDARIARAEYELFRKRQPGTAPEAASPLALREPQLAAARAALARDRAVLADAELALSRTEVLAPFSGIVRREFVDLGQFVAAGQGVGRLYATDAVEVVVPVSDAEAALIPDLWRLRAGDGDRRVRATVSAEYGDRTHDREGYVDRAEAALDEQTRTIDIIVRVPRPFSGTGPPLLVGQFVEIRIEGIAPERYFTVPRAALRTGSEVWALRADNTVAIAPVEVLQRSDDVVYVTGALDADQRVVVGGIRIATDGMLVRTGDDGG